MSKKPNQRLSVLVVPRVVVDNLVSDFKASENRTCAVFGDICDDLDMSMKLLQGDTVVHFDTAMRMLLQPKHQCYKMTGRCNYWITWMKHRLNSTKYRIDL